MSNQRLADARSAYGDKDASRKLHEKKTIAELGHKSVQTQEIDSHLRTAGVAATKGLVISLVLHAIFEDLGLGFWQYLVTTMTVIAVFSLHGMVLALWEKQSLRAVEKFEKARETWEMENFPDGEAQEMVVLYEAKGYTNEQARTVCDILKTRPKAFVDIMMVEELGILPSPDTVSVAIHSAVTFLASLIGGCVPAYLVTFHSDSVSLAGSAVALFVGGILLSRTTISGPLYCGVLNMGLGISIVMAARHLLAYLLSVSFIEIAV